MTGPAGSRVGPASSGAGVLGLRPMTRDDLPMLHDWLARPHVARWWGEPPSLATVREAFEPARLAAERVTPWIGTVDGQPVAYLQSYVALGAGDGWWEDETDPGVRGIDLTIAEHDRLGIGLGPRFVQALVARLFDDPSVTRVQADPSPDNGRALRCFEKAGFRVARTVDTPDGPAVLMLRARD